MILSHEGVTKTITVTRETFEDFTSDLLNQSRDLTISLVEELGLSRPHESPELDWGQRKIGQRIRLEDLSRSDES